MADLPANHLQQVVSQSAARPGGVGVPFRSAPNSVALAHLRMIERKPEASERALQDET